MADFSFEGLLGGINNAFGGGSSNYLDEYLTPDQKRMMQRNAMLAASAALLKAGGESTRRIGIGEALGEALQAGQGGYEKAQTGALTQMALKTKMDEAKRAKEFNEIQSSILLNTQGAIPSVVSNVEETAAGAGKGAFLPIRTEAPPPVDPNVFRASQYQRLAQNALKYGQPDLALKYEEMGQKINPRDELQGGLTPASDENGNPILVKVYKSGKVVTAEGFGVPREVVLQSIGDKIIAVDKNKIKTGTELAVTLSPYEQQQVNARNAELGMRREDLDAKLKNDAVRLGIDKKQLELAIDRAALSREEFIRGAYERVEAEGGNLFYVSKTPGYPSIPIIGGGGEPLKGKGGALTESQSNAFGFAQRMDRVNGILAPLEAAGSYPGVGSAIAGAIPFVGGTAARLAQNADVQRYQQAASDWIRAKLRKESGAAIGADEAKQEYATYFPVTGDSAAVIEQKRQARMVATEAMKMSAGKTYTPPAPVVPGAGGSGLTWDPAQKKFVNR